MKTIFQRIAGVIVALFTIIGLLVGLSEYNPYAGRSVKSSPVKAFEQWIPDSDAYTPADADTNVPRAAPDEMEDMNRLIQRKEPTAKKGESDKSVPAMLRGLTHSSEEAGLQFLRSIRKTAMACAPVTLQSRGGRRMRTAKEFSASAAPMILVCRKYRSRKRIDGIYRHADDLIPTPHKPKRVEGESLFAASVRFRYVGEI